MALINNNYVFVEEENVVYDAESTSHPVEKGIAFTDHVQRKPVEVSITGKIVNHGNVKASDTLTKIKELQKSGSLITYVGRTKISNLQIQSFNTNYTNANWGGCDFDMTLKEVRIAKTAYTPVKKTTVKKKVGTQQVSKGANTKVYYKVKKGDCVWNIVTKKYKTLKPVYSKTMDKCKWIMKQNPNAFSRKNDFGTLKIGAKLYVGYR